MDYKILWCLRERRVRISNTHGCLKTTHTSLWPLYYGIWGSLKIITYILIKDRRMERHRVILFFIIVWPLGMSTERFFYAGNSAPQPVLELVILLGKINGTDNQSIIYAEQHSQRAQIYSTNWFYSSSCWHDVPNNIYHPDSSDHGENSFTKF